VLAAGWTSLEIAKLVVAAFVPIAVAALGWSITRAASRLDQAQWRDRRLIDLRLEVYQEMARPLNDLLCFFRTVGDFQEITPPEALKRKRALDKAFYVNRYLMSEEWESSYRAFMDACFLTYRAAAKPAQLRASRKKQQAERREWEEEWADLLIPDTDTPTGLSELSRRYERLMTAFSQDIRVRSLGAPHADSLD
jgi:hypothetical protein